MNAILPMQAGPGRSVNDIAAMRPISADSHVTEPPSCYIDNIESKYRERAPHVEYDEKKGDTYLIDGMAMGIPLGLIAAAGKKSETAHLGATRFEDLHRGGSNGKDRIKAMEADGIAAEVVYPTVGMLLCNHTDFDYKNACFKAYNRWLAGYVAESEGRIFGIGQTAASSPEGMIQDFKEIKEAGFVGVMMPGVPQSEDYDSRIYDPVWATAAELDLPISFHILTSNTPNKGSIFKTARGPKINSTTNVIHALHDIIGLFVYTGVLDRHPGLKMITVEADAGWAPHYMQRLDYSYNRHRFHMGSNALSKMPSEIFRESIYMTFQEDWVAFQLVNFMNPKRLMWASDFPHFDSTWPNSMQLLADHTGHLDDSTLKDILRNNVIDLYKLKV